MTERRVYYDCVGPYFYDDEDDLDASEGLFAGRKQAAITTDGEILLVDGSGITLEGSDDNPSRILFTTGTSKTSYIAISAGKTDNPRTLSIYPDTHGQGHLYIGGLAGSLTPKMLRSFFVYTCTNGIVLRAYTNASYPSAKYVEVNISPAASIDVQYSFKDTGIEVSVHKTVDIGTLTTAIDDVYADDFQNVADFLHLDDRDDLAALEQIKGSGVVDERTGLEMIDDNTIPDWMMSKDKKTKEILRDPDGKPFLSLKMVTSLLMGACRQLNKKIEELEKKIEVKNA